MIANRDNIEQVDSSLVIALEWFDSLNSCDPTAELGALVDALQATRGTLKTYSNTLQGGEK